MFFYLQQKKESRTIDGADKEILAEAERLDVKAMGPLILSELLFNENIRDQVKKYKRHFLRVSWKTVVVISLFALYISVAYMELGWAWGYCLVTDFWFKFSTSSATTTRRPRNTCWEALSVLWSCTRSSCFHEFPSSSKTCMTLTCWRRTSYTPGQKRWEFVSEHCIYEAVKLLPDLLSTTSLQCARYEH